MPQADELEPGDPWYPQHRAFCAVANAIDPSGQTPAALGRTAHSLLRATAAGLRAYCPAVSKAHAEHSKAAAAHRSALRAEVRERIKRAPPPPPCERARTNLWRFWS